MRAIVLPLVNQVHSDAVAGAVDAEVRLTADAAARRGAGVATMEPGSPGPPLRTEPCSAGVGTGGASAGDIAAGGGTMTLRSGSAASGVGGGVAPGVAAGIATPERASASSSAATRCSSMTIRFALACSLAAADPGSPLTAASRRLAAVPGGLRMTSPTMRPTAAPTTRPLKPSTEAPMSAPSRTPIHGVTRFSLALAPVAAQGEDRGLKRFRRRPFGCERWPRHHGDLREKTPDSPHRLALIRAAEEA